LADLDSISELVENLAEEVEPHLHVYRDFLFSIRERDKPLSLFSSSSFHPKIESIRIGIFETAEADEHYSVNILYRSLIEHFVKAQYLWMRTLEVDTDEVGIDYWLFGNAQETVDYAKSLRDAYELLGVDLEREPLDILRDMKILGEQHSNRSIKNRMEQFRYKNMTRYIAEAINAKQTQSAPILSSVFPRYSELSSCVHGGPAATTEFSRATADISEAVDISTFASLYIRWSVYLLFYQYDKKMEPLVQITNRYLKKFAGHNN